MVPYKNEICEVNEECHTDTVDMDTVADTVTDLC